MRNLFFLLAAVLSSHAESLVFPPYGHSYGIRKATQQHLFMFFGPLTTFDDPQGIAACKLISRDNPETKNDDDELVVYGVNSGRHQIIYNTSMWTLALYGEKGSGREQFLFPRGIAANPLGHVYVADWGNSRIVHLFNPKRTLTWVRTFSGKSSTDRGLLNPSQVALDTDGMVYVTDTGNRRIVQFDSAGVVQRIIPSMGRRLFEDGPTTLAVADGRERWSHFRGDRLIFCADRNGRRLWKMRFDGTVLDTVTLPEGHCAAYAAVDYYHNLWVTSVAQHCILKFDRDLVLLDIFGSYGEGANQFIEPRGIAIWKRFGQTFIAEKSGAQYYWIGTSLKSKQLLFLTENQWRLRIKTSEHSYLSLFIPLEADTHWLMRRRLIYAGSTQLEVNNRELSKTTTISAAKILLEPTYSSYTYYAWIYPLVGGTSAGEQLTLRGRK